MIVSNNAANAVLNRVIVVPLSSTTTKVYPGEALVTLNSGPRKAMADQLMTASKKRIRSKLDVLSVSDVTAVESAILLQLGIRR
jgi:mRNA interferase MazF